MIYTLLLILYTLYTTVVHTTQNYTTNTTVTVTTLPTVYVHGTTQRSNIVCNNLYYNTTLIHTTYNNLYSILLNGSFPINGAIYSNVLVNNTNFPHMYGSFVEGYNLQFIELSSIILQNSSELVYYNITVDTEDTGICESNVISSTSS